MRFLVLLIAVTHFWLALPATAETLKALPTFKEIAERWRAREQCVTTLDMRWESDEFKSAEAAAFLNPWRDALATRDFSTNGTGRFAFDSDGRFRFNLNGKEWNTRVMYFTPRVMNRVVVKEIDTVFLKSNGLPPYASISNKTNQLGKHLDLKPLWMVFCATHAGDELFETDRPIKVRRLLAADRSNHLQLSQKSVGNTSSRKVVVDANRDYLPLKYEREVKNGVRSAIEIGEFEQFSPEIWVPVTWRIIRSFGAKAEPQWVYTAVVTQYQINTELEPDTFTLNFPKGTVVNDRIRGERYTK